MSRLRKIIIPNNNSNSAGGLKDTVLSNNNTKKISNLLNNNDLDLAIKSLNESRSAFNQSLIETRRYYDLVNSVAPIFGVRPDSNAIIQKIPQNIGKIIQQNQIIQDRINSVRNLTNETNVFLGRIRKEQVEKKQNRLKLNSEDALDKLDTQVRTQQGVTDILLSPPEQLPDDSIGKVVEFQDKIFKSWVDNDKPIRFNTLSQPFYGSDSDEFEQRKAALALPGVTRFFIEKLHGVSASGKHYRYNPISKTLETNPNNYENRMIFPAFIDSYSDNFSTNWNETSFLGVSENFSTYSSTSREITLDFNLVADFNTNILAAALKQLKDFQEYSSKIDLDSGEPLNKYTPNPFYTTSELMRSRFEFKENLNLFQQTLNSAGSFQDFYDRTANGLAGFVPGQMTGSIEQLWNRVTFLVQCLYPFYRKDGKIKQYPYIRLRLGDFIDVVARPKSMNFSELELGWDYNDPNGSIGVIPLGLKVQMTIEVVHMDTPNSNYYNFFHRRDFDIKNSKPKSLQQKLSYDETIDQILKDKNFKEKILGKIPERQSVSLKGIDIRQSSLFNDVRDGKYFANISDNIGLPTDLEINNRNNKIIVEELANTITSFASNISLLSNVASLGLSTIGVNPKIANKTALLSQSVSSGAQLLRLIDNFKKITTVPNSETSRNTKEYLIEINKPKENFKGEYIKSIPALNTINERNNQNNIT